MKHTRCASVAFVSLLALAAGIGCQDTLTTCRITEEDCQQEVYSHLLSLRGDGYDPYTAMPPITVISEDQFRQMLLDEPRTVSPWDGALTLLHFQAGTDSLNIDEQVANIAAYYSTLTKRVTVISHPTQTGVDAEKMAMITLAHEFVHSLQDGVLDLTKSDLPTYDAYLAYDTLIEGDARFYELLFANDLFNLGYSQSNIVANFTRYLQYDYDNLEQYGSALFAARVLTYSLGSLYEAMEYASGGNAAIRHGYAGEPRTTLGFLNGPASVARPLQLASGCLAPESSLALASAGGLDELGALLFYTFMRGWNVAHAGALATAQSWVGDSIRVQATEDLATTAVAWRIELSAPASAEVIQALGATGELSVEVSGNRLLITVSNSQSQLTWAPVPGCP